MRQFRFIAAASAIALLAACHLGAKTEERDAGPETSRTYNVGAFDKIDVAGPYDVTVTTGGKPGVSAKGGANLLDETDVIVEGGTLKIIPKKHNGLRFSFRKGKASFAVTTAALHGVSIAGSGDVNVDKIDGDFEGEVAGSGGINVAKAAAGTVKLSIAGSGGIAAAGTANSVKIDIAGSGSVDAGSLAAKTADVSIAGSGDVRASASDTAKVSIMGSGDVDIAGGAKCTVSKAGSGNVNCH